MRFKKTLKTLYDYISSCSNKIDIYIFTKHSDAEDFALQIKKIAAKEEKVLSFSDVRNISLDIAYCRVKIKLGPLLQPDSPSSTFKEENDS